VWPPICECVRLPAPQWLHRCAEHRRSESGGRATSGRSVEGTNPFIPSICLHRLLKAWLQGYSDHQETAEELEQASEAADRLRTQVLVAPVLTTIRRIATEARLGRAEGLPKPCVANCDTLITPQ
jgi:hypothetical protein